jgi:hypothetical protein
MLDAGAAPGACAGYGSWAGQGIQRRIVGSSMGSRGGYGSRFSRLSHEAASYQERRAAPIIEPWQKQ